MGLRRIFYRLASLLIAIVWLATPCLYGAPSITEQPHSAAVAEGERVTFSVTATDDHPLTYQWQRSADGGVTWTDQPGATARTYTVPGASAHDKDLYRCVISNGMDDLPGFSIRTAGASSAGFTYQTYRPIDSTHFSVEDGNMKAILTALGNDQWRLEIQAKKAIAYVYFPFRVERAPVAADLSQEIFYYPRGLGTTERASAHNQDFVWGQTFRYPGGLFAPLVVLASDKKAHMVAATNWPPKRVQPVYGGERMSIIYPEGIPAGGSATYQGMIVDVNGDASAGSVPWQLALDRYRAWLDSHMKPIQYPEWMWKGEGFYDVQLEFSWQPYDITTIAKTYDAHKHLYPWVQFWGQMAPAASNFCCSLTPAIDASYEPSLTNFVRRVVSEGGHAGYYSAPYYGDAAGAQRPMDTVAGQTWLKNWIAFNRSQGANAFYVDTLGGEDYGDPAQIMSVFSNGLVPTDSLIEFATDVYPAASLISGSLAGGTQDCGAPFKTPERYDRTTFPAFGRYLMGDRLFYDGIANSDSIFWGNVHYWERGDARIVACDYKAYCDQNGPCEYGTERTTFLLGAKWELRIQDLDTNEMVNAINAERLRVHWWERRPVYLATKGLDLTGISASSKVEVSRFQDKDGLTLFAVTNPKQVPGLSFRFNGRSFNIPTQKIAVLDGRSL